ncbi:MAG: SH3 domain-containing protein [Proteobacteria bacterium]|nr:SH3 domain-containing protein [Pseudomonadota bacterium]
MTIKYTIYTLFISIFFIILSATSADAERFSVSVPIANIRSGPGTSHKVLWNVEKYHPVEIIKKQGEWCQFEDFEHDKGWVLNSLIDKTPSVITIKNQCNVRSGPGSGYAVVFTVERAVPFKVLDKKGNWIQIEHADGDKGWIHASLVW